MMNDYEKLLDSLKGKTLVSYDTLEHYQKGLVEIELVFDDGSKAVIRAVAYYCGLEVSDAASDEAEK